MTRTARKARKRFVEASSWSDISNNVVDQPPSKKKERVEKTTTPSAKATVCSGRVDKKRHKTQQRAMKDNLERSLKRTGKCHKQDIDKDVDERRLKRREQRRMRRANKKVCYKCRKHGHRLEECPVQGNESSICFKCGSTEHTIKTCKIHVPSGTYPFANCFICGESGHLSRSCPDNPRGLYPEGGGCKLCGSVEHLRANCPKKHKHISELNVGLLSKTLSADDDISDLRLKPKSNKPKKQKVVKF